MVTYEKQCRYDLTRIYPTFNVNDYVTLYRVKQPVVGYMTSRNDDQWYYVIGEHLRTYYCAYVEDGVVRVDADRNMVNK